MPRDDVDINPLLRFRTWPRLSVKAGKLLRTKIAALQKNIADECLDEMQEMHVFHVTAKLGFK